MGLFDWAKDKTAELKADAEWKRLWRANPNGNRIHESMLVSAKENHGLLTIALADGKDDLIGWLIEVDEDKHWNGKESGYWKMWHYYTAYPASNMPLVGGITASGIGQGPYSVDKWHKRIVSRFPDEQLNALMVMQKSKRMRVDAQCLHGIFPNT